MELGELELDEIEGDRKHGGAKEREEGRLGD